jgi:hypothetical protein
MKRALKMLNRTITMLFLLSPDKRRDAMKRHSSAASLVLAVLVVLGLAGPVAAGEQVPFKGRFAGIATVTGGPSILSGDVLATGNATELGQFTLAIPHQVNRGTDPFPFPWTSTGSYQFVAANGDTLFASFTGLVNSTGTPGVLAAVETATITGGTGRFAGATGGFIVVRFVHILGPLPCDRTTDGSFNGTISSPGAAKR